MKSRQIGIWKGSHSTWEHRIYQIRSKSGLLKQIDAHLIWWLNSALSIHMKVTLKCIKTPTWIMIALALWSLRNFTILSASNPRKGWILKKLQCTYKQEYWAIFSLVALQRNSGPQFMASTITGKKILSSNN
jgi:hypothetical protein